MMDTTYVGMDAHAASIRVAVLRPGSEQADEWQLVYEPRGVKRLARRLTRMAAGPVLVCYEARPCGIAAGRAPHRGASAAARPGGGARPLPGTRGRGDRPHSGAPPPREAVAAAGHRLCRSALDTRAPPLAAHAALCPPPQRKPPMTTICSRLRAWRSAATRWGSSSPRARPVPTTVRRWVGCTASAGSTP